MADFRRKFVENEKGAPKVVKQLARACRAILSDEVPAVRRKDTRIIYPVFVTDEPTLETASMNSYCNEEFQKDVDG